MVKEEVAVLVLVVLLGRRYCSAVGAAVWPLLPRCMAGGAGGSMSFEGDPGKGTPLPSEPAAIGEAAAAAEVAAGGRKSGSSQPPLAWRKAPPRHAHFGILGHFALEMHRRCAMCDARVALSPPRVVAVIVHGSCENRSDINRRCRGAV